MSSYVPAILALEDGKYFIGRSVGAKGEATGEVVFNTSLFGYQEILTDPSYCNQMMCFTYPHIGNVGVNSEDVESSKVHVSGFIAKELSDCYSNFRAEKSLSDYLIENSVVGIDGIDTRELVLHLRTQGSKMGIIASGNHDPEELVKKAASLDGIAGQDLASVVSTTQPYDWKEGAWQLGRGYKQYSDEELAEFPLVVAYDFGVKYNILRLLVDQGLRVKVVPARFSAEQVLSLNPDAIFLSNGPGDPSAVTYAIENVKQLLGKKPIFGICLGHQILGHALGAPTFKLGFGHRGGNHPVRNENNGVVEITVQNHGFATDLAKVPDGVCVSHINLNDQTVEGFDQKDLGAFSVQYHPESSPGPRDAEYLFKEFRERIALSIHEGSK